MSPDTEKLVALMCMCNNINENKTSSSQKCISVVVYTFKRDTVSIVLGRLSHMLMEKKNIHNVTIQLDLGALKVVIHGHVFGCRAKRVEGSEEYFLLLSHLAR